MVHMNLAENGVNIDSSNRTSPDPLKVMPEYHDTD